MIQLKGMTWSHDRGIKPLLAASELFKKEHPEAEISWDARSLSDFELFPLEELADKYDFIMIDHPHIGTAYAQNLLLPLDSLLDPEFLADQKKNSVGQSFASYTWEGKQYALPADAAAQVCAYRKDLMGDHILPVTWKDFFSLAESLPSSVVPAIPFVPVHAYSSFFTLCSQMGTEPFWSDGSELNIETGVKVLELLQRILAASHQDSFYWDPINILDRMGERSEIAYTPLCYGYSNYARDGYLDHTVLFGNIPSDTGQPEGSMIGGVGLSISSGCKHTELAASFLSMTTAADFQKTHFFENDGQPGHRASWMDEKVNRECNGFFSQTLQTLDCGSMRPRFDGYIDFQAQAGEMIREEILKGRGQYRALVEKLNALLPRLCRIPIEGE
ncbi:MAG: ABC transporter substrate-binding protein [Spirochaetales bacterium]|nr:ABC transporter substrate-binding protein [Spirochaetales bacterium]